jgi:uncharacterized protein (DUF2147 family)
MFVTFVLVLLAGTAFGQAKSDCPITGCPMDPNTTMGLWSNGHWGGVVEHPTDPNNPVGLWRTVDDNTHKPKGVVMITQRGGEFFASIQAKLVNDPRPICTFCTDDRKNARIIGLEIVRHGRPSQKGPGIYGMKILDPEDGKEYEGFLQVLDGGTRLKVSGCVLFGLICRSQVWERLDSMPPEAHL